MEQHTMGDWSCLTKMITANDLHLDSIVFMQQPPLNDELKEHYNHESAAFKLNGDTSGFKFSDFKIVDSNNQDEDDEVI